MYIRRLLVLKEVDLSLCIPGLEISCITTLRVCNSAKKLNGCIYKFCKKSIHCTGYPLIQVEIVSVRKSLYVLAGHPKFSVDFSLFFGVWSLMDYLQCGCRCRCRYRCRCRSFCRCIFHNFCYLCIFHVFFLSF